MKSRYYVAVALAFFGAMIPAPWVHAAPTTPATTTQPSRTPEYQFLDTVAAKVLDAIRANQKSAKNLSAAFSDIFNQYVDTDWVGRFVLGQHWNKANPSQRQRFIASYRKFMAQSYAQRLQNYSGETYTISKQRPLGQGRSSLHVDVNRAGQAPVSLDYKIRQVNGGYKIYDIVVEGISLIATQRSEFESVIGRQGLDALIEALDKRTAA